jgi:hypothetical protein
MAVLTDIAATPDLRRLPAARCGSAKSKSKTA